MKRLDLVARISPRIVNVLGSARAHGHTSPRRKTNVEDVERELLNSEICANFCAGNYCCSFLARYSRDSPPRKGTQKSILLPGLEGLSYIGVVQLDTDRWMLLGADMKRPLGTFNTHS